MITKFSTAYDASKHCADTLAALIKQTPAPLICLAAGHTSLDFFDILISANKAGAIDFSGVKVVGLDEWAGLSGNDDGSCENFLRRSIFNHINVKEKNIRLFDGKASDLNEKCRQVDQFITDNGGIDYLLLGLGMNGHLALNEPGVDENKTAHVMLLDAVTKDVADKYFKEKPSITKGITLGIKNIVEARQVQLLVTGKRKSKIAAKMMTEPKTSALPGSLLRGLNNVEFVFDADASRLLNID